MGGRSIAVQVLLDTHVVVWWSSAPERLNRRQRALLKEAQQSGEAVAISSITLWELAMLAEKGRIEVPMPIDAWLEEIETDIETQVLPLTAKVAVESVRLGPGFPKDPADRIIVATARCHGLTLLTTDAGIRLSGNVPVI